MTVTVTTNVENVNIHRPDTMKAERAGETGWLRIRTIDGTEATVFMDYDMAQEIAELWEYMNREPEPPTYDEALAMKCDAEARTEEARRLKGMTV